MTSPTAEQRAKDALSRAALDDGTPEAYLKAIASAIRQAEDAAYERAALKAEEQSIHPLADAIGCEIRTLKHPKEPMTP